MANPHLVRAKQTRYNDIEAGANLPIRLDDHPGAEIIEDQGLVRLGHAQLPRQAGALDARPAAGARASVVSRDGQVLRLGLDDAGGHHAHANLGDELHADAGPRVRRLQVVDQLGQVLDRVDVVVGRRADETDARDRVPALGNVFGHLFFSGGVRLTGNESRQCFSFS